jgi:hypothetical protein
MSTAAAAVARQPGTGSSGLALNTSAHHAAVCQGQGAQFERDRPGACERAAYTPALVRPFARADRATASPFVTSLTSARRPLPLSLKVEEADDEESLGPISLWGEGRIAQRECC